MNVSNERSRGSHAPAERRLASPGANVHPPHSERQAQVSAPAVFCMSVNLGSLLRDDEPHAARDARGLDPRLSARHARAHGPTTGRELRAEIREDRDRIWARSFVTDDVDEGRRSLHEHLCAALSLLVLEIDGEVYELVRRTRELDADEGASIRVERDKSPDGEIDGRRV